MKIGKISKIGKKYRKLRHAFSAVEIAIVILIGGILISSFLAVSKQTTNNAGNGVTKKRMKAIYEAIGNYVVANKRLPCPAALNLSKADSNYGIEKRGANACSYNSGSDIGVYNSASSTYLVYGAVPVKTIGLSAEMAEDAFGSKIVYMINANLAGDFPAYSGGSISTANPSFPIESNSILAAEAASTTANAITITRNGNTWESYAALALISQGNNKFGSFLSLATTQGDLSSDSDEQSNYVSVSGWTGTFDRTIVAGSTSETFDDIVVYKKVQDFLRDFNLMSLVPCLASGYTGAADAYFGATVYSPTACTTPAKTYPSKKCGPYGKWIETLICDS